MMRTDWAKRIVTKVILDEHVETNNPHILSQTHVRLMNCHMCVTREKCVCVTLCAYDEVFCLQLRRASQNDQRTPNVNVETPTLKNTTISTEITRTYRHTGRKHNDMLCGRRKKAKCGRGPALLVVGCRVLVGVGCWLVCWLVENKNWPKYQAEIGPSRIYPQILKVGRVKMKVILLHFGSFM